MTLKSIPTVPTPMVLAASIMEGSICPTRLTVPWKVGQKTAKKITAMAACRKVDRSMMR